MDRRFACCNQLLCLTGNPPMNRHPSRGITIGRRFIQHDTFRLSYPKWCTHCLECRN
ncbi:hypothetical protein JCGZ_00189 [Jatropha curcas]|uniref:Uncharacterized protein n=1 Tax=Jatropha curcas TaxID=180498 RepID=A0A067JH66_JATCU|nr:hypothetical protein JCGZ_00189 [Jatropha curcas]